jgi:hypothetical protein
MKRISNYQDFVNEGRSRHDGLASHLTKTVFKSWIDGWKAGKKVAEYFDQVEEPGMEFDLTANLHITKKVKGFEIPDSTGADGRDYDPDDDTDMTPFINIDFAVNPEWLPGYWSEIYMHLADVMRHEMEHITQDGEGIGNYRAGKPNEDDQHVRELIKAGILPKVTYLMLPKEVDANIQGLRYEAKKRKEAMSVTVNRYLDTQDYLTADEREDVLKLWRERAAKIGGIPGF